MFYSIWVVLISILPYFEITGELKLSIIGVLAVIILGSFLIYKSYILFLDGRNENAKKLMLTSVIYLTFIQLTFLFDKIF